jgi:porin
MKIRLAILAAVLLLIPANISQGQCCFDDECYCAETLTGDWCGNRSCWGKCGITFDFDLAHFYQGVAHGGLDQRFGYAGHGDYVTNVDFGTMGIQDGLFLKVRAEHRFGENINAASGAILPNAVLTSLPAGADYDDLVISNFLFTQFLNERFAVFFGKLDTFDGDRNAFAHGRGKTQFLNAGFVVNPATYRTIPYSTLGCGFTVLGDEGTPVFTYTLLNARDTVRTSGFDELFEDGVAMGAELRLPTDFLDMPGHQLFGATWNSRDFVALGQDPRIVLPNIPINETDGSWSLYWNFDQYLAMHRCDPTKGWGVFGRAAIADDSNNPVNYFLSFGLGGHNPHCCNRNDTFGIGWYVSGISDEVGPLAEDVLGPLDNGYGVELFYNREVTKWLYVTPDLQVLFPARQNVDPSILLGVRAVMQL